MNLLLKSPFRLIVSYSEYKLWTDASAREFIAEHYPWFLDTFDGYTYPIQRADAIRYFVLYHFGGIYIDLDIGCLRPLDPLLAYPVILPKTIPVGVSNDLMFAEKEHPFMAQTIHKLAAFDYSWIINYPTVMFSTGPMFLSAQYGIYTSSHPPTVEHPEGEVRILAKALYGKNALPSEAPHAFFEHFYGSSWHDGDAAFIGFLGKWGKILMWIGLAVLVFGLVRLALAPHVKQRKYSLRRVGGYEVLMPRWRSQNGRWQLDLGWFTLSASSNAGSPPSTSPITSEDEEDVQLLPLSFHSRSGSPTPSDSASDTTVTSNWSESLHHNARPVADVVRRTTGRIWSFVSGEGSSPHLPTSSASGGSPSRQRRRQGSRGGVLFFLPAFFTPSHGVELPHHSRSRSRSAAAGVARTSSPLPELTPLHSRDTTEETAYSDSEYPPDKTDSHLYPRTSA